MNKQHSIYIIDDHQIVIDGILLMLEGRENLVIKGFSRDALIALEEIKSLQPDTIICDIHMPSLTGIELSKLIRKACPSINILILTMSDDAHIIQEMVATGVRGFILKNKGKEELLEALAALKDGNTFFSQELVKNVIAKGSVIKTERLTLREIEIIRLLAAGSASAQIAASLFISEHTVETHRRNILRKTETHSTVEMLNFVRQHALVSL